MYLKYNSFSSVVTLLLNNTYDSFDLSVGLKLKTNIKLYAAFY